MVHFFRITRLLEPLYVVHSKHKILLRFIIIFIRFLNMYAPFHMKGLRFKFKVLTINLSMLSSIEKTFNHSSANL